MEIRAILKKVFLLSLTIVYIAGMIWGYYEFVDNHEKTYCGKVYKKILENYFHKSTVRTEYYMIVNFDEIGQREIGVTRSTYFNKNERDRICFYLDVRERNVSYGVYMIWSFVCWFLTAYAIIVGTGWCIYWLFTGKW